jgi:hypothetical protein
MGIEQREGRGLGQHRAASQGLAAAVGRVQPAAPGACALRSAFHPYQTARNDGAGQCQRPCQLRAIRPSARAMPSTPAVMSTASASAQKSTTAAHVLTTQALAQDERVLRANGHDETEAQPAGSAATLPSGEGRFIVGVFMNA